MNKVIVIAGPTATGKTALSVELAKKFSGEVISADSVQIYKELNIGSAKPDEAERKGIPHHMMDFLDPGANFNVADFCALAKKKIDEIHARGNIPIIAGGTGLYISSLVNNISFVKEETNEGIREKLYREMEEIGEEKMHEKLAEIDPTAAENIHPNNKKRVIRALEIFYTTGKTMTEQNALSKNEPSPYEFILIGLNVARETLYERIDKRVDVMVERGLFEEVAALLNKGISKDAQSMQGIGYKEAVRFLEGEISKSESIELIKKNSRNYAKRQLTWFKREPYRWFDAMSSTLFEDVKTYLSEKL